MKISAAQALSNYQLQLRFDDGVEGTVDLSDLAGRGVFQIWLQPGIFEQVRITGEGALEWPDEIDLCPDALYLRLTGTKPEEFFPSLASRLSHA